MDISTFFQLVSNNRSDIEDIISHLGGIKGLLDVMPDIFRIWKTIAAHASAASQAGQDPKAALAHMARQLQAPETPAA